MVEDCRRQAQIFPQQIPVKLSNLVWFECAAQRAETFIQPADRMLPVLREGIHGYATLDLRRIDDLPPIVCKRTMAIVYSLNQPPW